MTQKQSDAAGIRSDISTADPGDGTDIHNATFAARRDANDHVILETEKSRLRRRFNPAFCRHRGDKRPTE